MIAPLFAEKDKTSPTETIRLMPNGVKSLLVKGDENDLNSFPGPVLEWMNEYDLIRKDNKKSQPKKLLLNEKGRKVKATLVLRLEGKTL